MSNQIELRHLRYFLTVAENLHFRKAAEKLFISQPGLSRQIKQLEDELGYVLFERHNRKVELTQAGEFLNKELRIVFRDLDNLFDHARHLHEGVEGQLQLGYVGSAIKKIIPQLLLKFKEINPNIKFNLSEMDNQKQIDSLLIHEIDLGFVRLERVPKDIQTHIVLKEPFCVALPKNHPLDSKSFRNVAQLKDDSFILFDHSHSPSYFEKIMQIFDDHHFKPQISHNTVHAGTIFTLIKDGFGISIIPKSLKENNKSIKYIDLDKIPQRTYLSAVWNKNNRNPILSGALKLLNISPESE